MGESDSASASASALADELRNVVNEAEALLRAIAEDRDSPLGALKDRVHESLDVAKARLADLQVEAQRTGRRAAAAANTWVERNPWTAVALGAGIGVVVGILLAHRGAPQAVEPPSAE